MQISEINFKAGSYITVENEIESNNFFIIKSGQVKSTNSVNKISGNRILNAGDFFGVISAMTNRPRLESTISLTNTKLIIVNKKNFGVLLKKSSPLALKIIKSFSNELRVYDKILAEKTIKNKNNEKNRVEEQTLYEIGNFYLDNGKHSIATYVLIQLIKFYPNSQYTTKIMELLKNTKQDLILKNNKNKFKSLKITFQDEEMLFCEDEPGFEAFIIKTGKVKITKVINNKEILLAVLKSGDIFGEMAILNNTKRAASAISFGETECFVLNIDSFNKIIQENVALSVKLITLLSERIWTIYKQIENLSFKKIKTRIYDTLFTQILTHNVRIGHQVEFLFPIGKYELSKMLGKEGLEFEQAVKQVLDDKFLSLYNNKFLCTNTLELKKETEFAKKTDHK